MMMLKEKDGEKAIFFFSIDYVLNTLLECFTYIHLFFPNQPEKA